MKFSELLLLGFLVTISIGIFNMGFIANDPDSDIFQDLEHEFNILFTNDLASITRTEVENDMTGSAGTLADFDPITGLFAFGKWVGKLASLTGRLIGRMIGLTAQISSGATNTAIVILASSLGGLWIFWIAFEILKLMTNNRGANQ